MRKLVTIVSALVLLSVVAVAVTTDFGDRFFVRLSGYEEVPVISTTGKGRFYAKVSEDECSIQYRLSYSDLEGAVTQAHIHLGQKGVNGGISAFLCSNLPNPPEGTQACPPPPATIAGTITADNIIGPAAQGIAPGELSELVKAMRAGLTYANVHSDKHPAGEIRSQIEHQRGHRHFSDEESDK